MPSHGGHFGTHDRRQIARHFRGLDDKDGVAARHGSSFLSIRPCGGHFQAIESMNFASATSFSLSPPASWVESTISTLL